MVGAVVLDRRSRRVGLGNAPRPLSRSCLPWGATKLFSSFPVNFGGPKVTVWISVWS